MSASPEAELPPLTPASHHNGLLEVFRRHYLLRLLVHSTVQSRYQGTFLGWAWSYLQPAVRFCMYYFIFQVFIGRGGEPGSARYVENFAVHLVAGMIAVHFFTETFNGGTRSLVSNRSLIVKLAMPRELFPVATMLVALWHTIPMIVIISGISLLLGWVPDPTGIAAGLLGFGILIALGLALALVFSVANVFFRDFSKVVQTLTQFTTFSVPMIYPFTFVEIRFGEFAQYYLLNPLAEAVLLVQRCFWTGTTEDPAATAARHLPDDLFQRGGVMLGISVALLVVAQIVFTRLERRIPERL
ncbi:ABC transporter permease [Nocardioides coralli]|uniref:ABC transporter permease n=1 Tax=Nocardioides coralli TaxID=2872154 RepID=UPI001CA45C48|nr:ABC transporter permease [Nocardioides coralli]QZY30009.1 ABC transporter permease [Nocardioides coralli]